MTSQDLTDRDAFDISRILALWADQGGDNYWQVCARVGLCTSLLNANQSGGPHRIPVPLQCSRLRAPEGQVAIESIGGVSLLGRLVMDAALEQSFSTRRLGHDD